MATRILAGIVLVKRGKILLVHPTGGPDYESWSIPKGHQDRREPTVRAALREVQEEVGLRISPELLQGTPKRLWKNKKKVLFYWVVDVSHLGLPNVLPIDQLQLEEVDEARFVDLLDADFLIEPWMTPLLNEVS